MHTPLVRLSNLFPDQAVYAKCEFLAPSGCFKIRGAMHLLAHLSREPRKPDLIVPSSGNTAVGAAAAARIFDFRMTGVVPRSIAKAKDEKLQKLGVDLVKIEGGGNELLCHAQRLAGERGGYFVHPHLDRLWTDGYQRIAAEVLQALPACATLVFPLGGGGLLMGLTEHLRKQTATVRLIGCEPFNYPKYAKFDHARSATIADGLLIESPHPAVMERIAQDCVEVVMVTEADIRASVRDLFFTQGLVVEPSSAITTAFVRSRITNLPQPICVVFTGQNIAPEDHANLVAQSGV